MAELFYNAYINLISFLKDGKFIGIFLVAVAYLIFVSLKKSEKTEQKQALKGISLYSGLMGFVCIFPPLTALLLFLQTSFYGYCYTWSYVPVSLVIALAFTIFITDIAQKDVMKKNQLKVIVIVIFALAIMICGGRLGQKVWTIDESGDEECSGLISHIEEKVKEDIILWAPEEIIDSARRENGYVKLIYGRNMWDKELDAYSYDVYDEETKDLYDYMQKLEKISDISEITSEETTVLDQLCNKILLAGQKGANVFILPGSECINSYIENSPDYQGNYEIYLDKTSKKEYIIIYGK